MYQNVFHILYTTSVNFLSMKKMLPFILYFTILSCNEDIDFLKNEEPKKLVVWCQLHPDSIPKAQISSTELPLSSKTDRSVKDALAILYQNNRAVDTLTYDSLYFYSSKSKFKPTAKNTYTLKIFKDGYPVLETYGDTMPEKPRLLRYIAEDSIRNINNNADMARLQIFTDNPKYALTYNLSQGFYQYFNTSGVLGDATLSWQLVSTSCNECNVPINYYNYNVVVNKRPPQLKNKKMRFYLKAITKQTEGFIKEINKLKSTGSIDVSYTTDLFWSPTFINETVKNGYGYLGCYNTLDFEVQF
jgi:hypothetical protein